MRRMVTVIAVLILVALAGASPAMAKGSQAQTTNGAYFFATADGRCFFEADRDSGNEIAHSGQLPAQACRGNQS
jgi:hypothetical protein